MALTYSLPAPDGSHFCSGMPVAIADPIGVIPNSPVKFLYLLPRLLVEMAFNAGHTNGSFNYCSEIHSGINPKLFEVAKMNFITRW